ncbi:MAG TPA: SDR family oxidoreductase [Desulfonatronum sp.]|nr:SDR family oxidoreductase [Desulfonatronum sp.]
MTQKSILITGATGYIGGRLVKRLLQDGYKVIAMARSLGKLGCRAWAGHENIRLVQGDVMDPASLDQALAGCEVAYYLVHSMTPGSRDFADVDRIAAQNMAQAATRQGVRRIIYLGGLGEESDPDLSKHLRSRLEVAKVLEQTGVPVTFLRAALIIGSGSASFEILRYLTERLPVMVTPRWVRTQCQPIAVSNVIEYLAGCLERPETSGQTYDIGGPDILTYEQMFQIYARIAGLRPRLILPVPLLTPRLSSLWINFVTPVPAAQAKPLVLGLRNRVVCRDNRIREIISQDLLSFEEAVTLALEKIRQLEVETCWSDAGFQPPPEWIDCGDAAYAGGTLLGLSYSVKICSRPDQVWPVLARLGGETGWYYGNRLWRLRGFLDRMIGGVGLRRGRRHPTQIREGDALDFWRVLAVEPDRRLRLLAEMKVPGQALLDFELHPAGDNGDHTELIEKSRFLPRGLWGLVYWYATYPLHVLIFKGMLKTMAKQTGRAYGTVRPLQGHIEKSCVLREK